jgi:hypothetical protein
MVRRTHDTPDYVTARIYSSFQGGADIGSGSGSGSVGAASNDPDIVGTHGLRSVRTKRQ